MNDQDFEAYAELKRFNTNVADTWDAALSEALERIAKPVADVSMLDYGCGDGKYFAHLVGKRGLSALNVHGAEVSSRRVARCHEIGWTNARLLQCGNELPYAEASFDLVNMMEVIEHIPQAQGRQTLAELRRVLRPNGVLLISTPNYPIKRFYDLFDAVIHGKWARLRDDPTHVAHYNTDRLQQILRSNFRSVEPRLLKPGFLYKRSPKPFFLHKLFFLCQA